jgi:3-deoxy-manno-octulosonate cytidylyltransferase (CMP-KDO synthetase)
MGERNQVVGVIPARYASTRLPGKPLLELMGRPLVEWVYRAAMTVLPRVIVATDDKRILDVVQNFGGEACMTPKSCLSGTDRVAFVAKNVRARFYANIQGDEPLIHPETIRSAVEIATRNMRMGTAATILGKKDEKNPHVVKVVMGQNGRALYFSRAAIPFKAHGAPKSVSTYKHLGIYVYPRGTLLKLMELKPTILEKTEKLEQLRALFYGIPIHVAITPHDSVGVDTRADLARVSRKLKKICRGAIYRAQEKGK